MNRPSYPSDHRRYFRVYEDITCDHAVASLSRADRWTFIELLAWANRVKLHQPRSHPALRPGTVNAQFISWDTLRAITGCRQMRDVRAAAARLVHGGCIHASIVHRGCIIFIPKWASGLYPLGAPVKRGGPSHRKMKRLAQRFDLDSGVEQ